MTLSTLIHTAAPQAPHFAAPELGVPLAGHAAAPLSGGIAAFAARLQALCSPSPTAPNPATASFDRAPQSVEIDSAATPNHPQPAASTLKTSAAATRRAKPVLNLPSAASPAAAADHEPLRPPARNADPAHPLSQASCSKSHRHAPSLLHAPAAVPVADAPSDTAAAAFVLPQLLVDSPAVQPVRSEPETAGQPVTEEFSASALAAPSQSIPLAGNPSLIHGLQGGRASRNEDSLNPAPAQSNPPEPDHAQPPLPDSTLIPRSVPVLSRHRQAALPQTPQSGIPEQAQDSIPAARPAISLSSAPHSPETPAQIPHAVATDVSTAAPLPMQSSASGSHPPPPPSAATVPDQTDANEEQAPTSTRPRAGLPQSSLAGAAQSAAVPSTRTAAAPSKSASPESAAQIASPAPAISNQPVPVPAPNTADSRLPHTNASPTPSPLSAETAFSALDAAAPAPGTVWTHAGTHHAEAGFLDPSLGWVGVRAEVSGGALHAAILPASSQAADALSAHLPALHAYVSQQHGQDIPIGLSWRENSSAGGGFQQSPQRDPNGSAADDPPAAVPAPTGLVTTASQAVPSVAPTGAPPPASGGRYISVLA